MQAALGSTSDAFRDERAPWLVMIGRLKPGVSRAAAQAELAVIAAQQDRLDYGRQTVVRLTNGSLIDEPAVRPLTFWIVPLVMGALSLVLLIACANVTMLLLSRAAERQHEMAVRLSLGASRSRLLRMLLTESLLLSAMAVPLSAWLAYEVPVVFKQLIPTLPFYPFHMDFGVFAYLAGLTTAAGVLAGIAPALESLRPSLSASLQGHDPLAAVTRWRTRDLLVAVQVAMSLVLLAGGALFVRAEYRMVHADPGFEMDRVLMVTPRLRVPPHTPATIATFQRAIVDRLVLIPGVRAAARASDAPLGDGESASPTVTVTAAEGTATTGRTASTNIVSREFFDTLNIPLVRGRVFEPGEAAGRLPPIILSESLAHDLWPGRDPIGEAVEINNRPSQVIGVVRDTRSLLRDAGIPTVYELLGAASATNTILVRFDGDTRAAASAVRAAVSALDADAFVEPRTLSALRDEAAAKFMRLVLSVLFLALVAGVLAIVGIYAVVAFAMSRRTKEIGIRVALGATRLDIIRLVMSSGTKPILAGLAAGTGIALLAAQALMKVMANAPVPLEPRNPTTYAAVAAVLAAAAVTAMLGPAWRAASNDPVRALRSN
jgi:predicted permease